MQQTPAEREAKRVLELEMERVAQAFMADPAFADCREDEKCWEATVADGLDNVA